MTAPFDIMRLTNADSGLYDGMLDLFADAFDDAPRYRHARPSAGYRSKILANNDFIALLAVSDGAVIGALAAYVLTKFEQERSEVYIYDLAVAELWRRSGVATALIDALRPIASDAGADIIFVQADYGDDPAIELYTKLGTREDVMHFDISTR